MRTTTAAVILVSIFAAAALLASCEKSKTAGSDATTLMLEDFSLFSLAGNKLIKSADFKGRPVVINFWASWCGPCREEMPFFERVWNQHKDKGLIFIGIDTLDDVKRAREFLNGLRISYLNLDDSSGEMSSRYGVSGLPVTLFINREGKVAVKYIGSFVGEKGEAEFLGYLEGIMQ
ncbi:MAG: TlpA disulfide reductase family protein [Deltaproteobacteria bacterium]